jgi:hypothetical protein
LARAIAHIAYSKRISASPEPLAHFWCVFFLKMLLVRCIKRLKTSSRGLGWRFTKKNEQGPQCHRFRKKYLPSDFNDEVEVEDRY